MIKNYCCSPVFYFGMDSYVSLKWGKSGQRELSKGLIKQLHVVFQRKYERPFFDPSVIKEVIIIFGFLWQ